MDVSVIIPVYNTSKDSLLKCFESMRVMDGVDYEVIVINDGSEAEVAIVCEEYAEEHNRFRYIAQENKGVSAARNAGIMLATGKYVMFVDADDELKPFPINHELLKNDWDIVFFNAEMVEGACSRQTQGIPQEESGRASKKELMFAACRNQMNAVWAKWFLRSFLLECGICFDEKMVVGEDARFVFSAVLKADHLFYERECIYRYYHSYDNADDRIVRFPKRNIENALCLYRLRTEGVEAYKDQLQITDSDVDGLYKAISAQVIKDLFEAEGLLAIANKKNHGLEDQIRALITLLEETHGNGLSKQTQIKCKLLKYKITPLIKIHARLRKLYLKKKMCK